MRRAPAAAPPAVLTPAVLTPAVLTPAVVLAAVLALAACGPSSPAGPFRVTISGEAAATEGFAFPPASAGAPYFVDGWEFVFDSAVVAVDKVTVSEDPDLSPADQSKTGRLVAQLDGPWVVDLAKPGPLVAKEQNGRAVELGVLQNQNRAGGAPFDATQKYAFGFDLATASAGARNVNGVGAALLAQMAAKGQSVLLKGTATWKGGACRTTNAGYDFGRFPRAVAFELGFKAPVTYRNCLNPELQPAESRGIQGQRGGETVAQVTLHLDHPFWEALEEDAPLRFDALAARRTAASGAGPATATVTLDDLAGLDFQAPLDAQGLAVPWRACGAVQPGERTAGNVSYDPKGTPVSAAGGAAGLKDLAEYMTYNLSNMGHLNNDGLCFPARNFPAPR